MRAEQNRSRAASCRPRALVVSAVAGGVLALASAPAAYAAGDFKPQPHAEATATATKPGHGHGHDHTTGPAGSGRGSNPKSAKSTTFTPNTATASPSPAPSTAVDQAPPSWTGSVTVPATVAPPAPAATTSAPAAEHAGATWTRNDDRSRADRGVVRAFAADLKSAGRSAGFPALLIGVMVAFLLVQHRLDKRDVKLSHADWVSDQGLEFSAPSTIPTR